MGTIVTVLSGVLVVGGFFGALAYIVVIKLRNAHERKFEK